jgi:hypothetical protein
MNDRIEKIEEISSKGKATTVEPEERVSPNKERFDSMLNRESKESVPVETSIKETPHLVEAAQKTQQPGVTPEKSSTEQLLSQTQETITRIEDIKQTLASPSVSIKRSAQELLQNKLTHIDESLKIALSKAGSEFQPQDIKAESPHAKVNPVERFLHFLTDGQWQLQNLGKELRVMGENKQELSPVNMLAIQVKMGQIQQELELFSNLLNKALESVKTIMNIQV